MASMSKRMADSSLYSVQGGDLAWATPWPTLQTCLKCKTCQVISTPPLYVCTNGHNMCGNCGKKCACGSNSSGIRNSAIETIIETCSFACDNVDQGCTGAVGGLELSRHRKECRFRLIQCHYFGFDGCKQCTRIKKDYFLDHLITVHKFNEYKLQPKSLAFLKHFKVTLAEPRSLATFSIRGSIMKFDDQIFVTRTAVSQGVYNFGLEAICTEAVALNYNVELTFRSKGNEKSFKAILPVDSVHVSNTDFLDSSLKISMTRGMLEQFSTAHETEDKKIVLEWETEYRIFKIMKIKIEVE